MMKRSRRITKAMWLVIVWMCAVQPVVSQSAEGQSEFIAGYHLELHCLLLGKSLLTAEGELKDFGELSPAEIATIYHELWHAWFIEVESKRKGPLYRMMQGKVARLYAAYPEEKRMEIYEEAVADFIDAVVETYVQVRRFLSSKTPERRQEIRSKTAYLEHTYGRLFSDGYNGYYTRKIAVSSRTTDMVTSPAHLMEAVQQLFVLDAERVLDSFIQEAERAQLPVGYLREASRAIRGVIFIDMSSGAPMLVLPQLQPVQVQELLIQLVQESLQPGFLAGTMWEAWSVVGTVSASDTATTSPATAEVVFAQVYLDQEDIDAVIKVLLEGKLGRETGRVFGEERFR